jgi:hypothetical protein
MKLLWIESRFGTGSRLNPTTTVNWGRVGNRQKVKEDLRAIVEFLTNED